MTPAEGLEKAAPALEGSGWPTMARAQEPFTPPKFSVTRSSVD
jgi:hypothetical protein